MIIFTTHLHRCHFENVIFVRTIKLYCLVVYTQLSNGVIKKNKLKSKLGKFSLLLGHGHNRGANRLDRVNRLKVARLRVEWTTIEVLPQELVSQSTE